MQTEEAGLRIRLGLPDISGSDLPSFVVSGDFSCEESRHLKAAFKNAINGRSKLPANIRAIEGMSGQKYRTFINSLLEAIPCATYLEIGSWHGSTAAAAIYGNDVEAVCIDNWSQLSGNRQKFVENLSKAKSNSNHLRLIETDFREVDYRSLGQFKVFLFDGPHSEIDHLDGILIPQACLDERFFLIVDDWNWPMVRSGTMLGLLAAECLVEASVQVRTTNDNTHPSVAFGASDWHNGYFIAVIRKKQSR